MGNYRLVISILILSCFLHLLVNTQKIRFIDSDMNSTNVEYRNSISTWFHQQLIICIISVSLGTLLVFITFIVPAVIIIRRIRRDRNRLNFKAIRRISDFI